MSKPSVMFIGKVPGRKGVYLSVQEGNTIRTVARFVKGEASADEFIAWATGAGVKVEAEGA